MKPLSEYLTPETETLRNDMEGSMSGTAEEFAELCESLEQKLAAAREALAFYANPSDYAAPLTGGLGKLYFDCGRVAQETLNLTAP